MHCAACSRFRYMKLDRYGDTAKLADISATLTCSRCRSSGVEARAVDRDPKTGFWPAEYA